MLSCNKLQSPCPSTTTKIFPSHHGWAPRRFVRRFQRSMASRAAPMISPTKVTIRRLSGFAGLDHYGKRCSTTSRARPMRAVEPAEPPFAALAAAIRRHALPIAPFRELLSAFRQDVMQAPLRATIDELLDYCRRSANPIGRLLLHLYGVSDEVELGRADAICTGLQLANFWQDVARRLGEGARLPAGRRHGALRRRRAAYRRRHR